MERTAPRLSPRGGSLPGPADPAGPSEPAGHARPWRPTPFVLGSGLLHGAALLTLATAPRHWRWIAGALIANHCALTAASLWPQSDWLGENLVRLPAAAARRGEVALTFDDGPDPEITPRVLDLLAERGVLATFFLIGRHAAAHPDLAAEIARRGHRVENHTWSHPWSFALYPPHALAREVARAQEAVTRAAGSAPRLFRAPAGFRNPALEPVLAAAGLTLASWTRRGFDTVDGRPERVADRLLTGLAPGDVLLLHDGPTAARTAAGRPVALEALPRLLDGLAARGLTAVPFAAGAE